LISTLILLLVAGHETTVNLIGNGTLALLRHPDQWRALVDDPSLARNATEELLRFDSPVQMTTRLAFEDLEIAGTPIRRGTEVFFVLGSANRDPRAFVDPDRLDITRDVGRIMSFGMGIHFCLGAPLARLEGEIAFRTLAQEAPGLRLATEAPRWRAGLVLRGLQELPVTVAR
jgi:cytochrome P450